MVFIFTDIPDPFYNSMRFNKYQNVYGDLVDEVDNLVIYGSQVSLEMTSSIFLFIIPKCYMPYHAYSIENNTKFSIVKRGGTSEYWGFSPHYG